jgi:Na+/proline symporter
MASAMGTLSSSISALASSTYLDLFKTRFPKVALSLKQEVTLSRAFTLFWGFILIGGALLFKDVRSPVVELGLRIASVPYGALLGTFFLGLFFTQASQRAAFIGLATGLTGMILILTSTGVDFTWHTLMGCLLTVAVGGTVALLEGRKEHS